MFKQKHHEVGTQGFREDSAALTTKVDPKVYNYCHIYSPIKDRWSGYAYVYKLESQIDLVPKFIKISNGNICFCKQCKSSDIDEEVSKGGNRFKQYAEEEDERADCECNPVHRLTFSCSYKVELCTFASYSEK